MASIDYREYRNRFWTAQLIAGTTLALKGAHAGWHEGGLLLAAGLGAAGFLVVMPIAAAVVYLLLRFGVGSGPSPKRTRWTGAVITGVAICAAAVIVGLIGRQ
jgi:hypothetical protein